MSFDHIAQPWQATTNNTKNRLKIKSNSMFFFMHHAKNWNCIRIKNGKKTKAIWLPALNKVPIKPGVNLMRGSVGNVNTGIARTHYQDKGFVILDPAKHDYCRVYPAIRGKYHTTKFVKLEDLAGEIIVKKDTASFYKWLCSLVAENYIELPHEHMIKKIMHRQSELINRHVNKQHIPSSVAEKTPAEKLYADMIEATEKLSEGLKYYE